MNAKRKQITINAELATALRRAAAGKLVGYHQHPNGDITFEIDAEVATKLDNHRQPGDDDSALIRRALKLCLGLEVPRTKPN